MLMIPVLTSARIVPRASKGSDTMQLICTTGMAGFDCSFFYGTSCSSAGVLQNPGSTSMPSNGDCTSKHCSCKMALPIPCVTETGGGVVCGPYASALATEFPATKTAGTGNASAAASTSSMTTLLSGSAFSTVTMTVTVTQHHRADNGTCSYNETATQHHHHSTSDKSMMTYTQSASAFTVTGVTLSSISSIPLISLTGSPVTITNMPGTPFTFHPTPPPSASSLTGQPSFLPPNPIFGAVGTLGGADAAGLTSSFAGYD